MLSSRLRKYFLKKILDLEVFDSTNVVCNIKNAALIFNKIRAISKPYPGSFGEIDKNKYRIWKAMPCDNISELEDESPGNHIFENNSGLPIVKCRDKCINILDYEEI